jgi:hypothetical protein
MRLKYFIARFFAERQGKADFVQFRAILLRKGGLPPCEGDTLWASPQTPCATIK